MKLDINARLRSKPFVVAVGAFLGMVAIDIFSVDPAVWQRYVDAILWILILGGVVIDTSTPGISDKSADKHE